ncbi:MAG: TonB-dependent receptor, partial [Nitrospirales bacterium]|nr:TonB-dependent receptor [Nitrospirales bacterium]
MIKGPGRFLSFCLAAAAAVCLASQQSEAAGEDVAASLDEIVVSATKTEKSLADVPASVTVVTKEDLKKKNYVNLNEALETIAGVFSYEGRGIATTSPVVNLRWFHGHMRTLIMVNGQPISPNLYGMALVHWSAIPVDDVERIEVVRGPSSALYGGDAVGGVINIITKCPEKFEATVRTGYGSDDTYKIHLSTGLKLRDNLNLFLGYDKKRTDGYVSDFYVLQPTTADPAAIPVTGAVKQPYRTGGDSYVVGDLGRLEFDEQTFTFGLNWKPTSSSYLTLKSLISGYEITPVGSASYLRDGSGNEVRSGKVTFMDNGNPVYLSLSPGKFLNNQNGEKTTGIYTAEYGTKISDDLDLKATVGLTDFHKEKFMMPGSSATETGGPGTLIDAPSTILQTELQANYKGVKGMVLTGGLSYRRDEGEFTLSSATNWQDFSSASTLLQRIEPSSNRYGLYLQAEINPMDRVVLYLGGRYDRWDSEATNEIPPAAITEMKAHAEDSFSPKAAIVYTPFDNTIVRLSGGKAFRVPNFFELYQPLYAAGATYLPNPGLKPETTWAWEVGVEQ